MDLSAIEWQSVAVLLAQAALVAVFLLALSWTQAWLGLAPLAVAIGSLQFLATLLAQCVYLQVYPGVLVTPGSAVLFTGILFGVLIVYVRGDASEVRRMIYGLLATSVLLGGLALLIGIQLTDPNVVLISQLPPSVFAQNIAFITTGTVVLFGDILALVLVYEALSRWTSGWLFVRVWLSMAAVLAFDTVVFVTINFTGHERQMELLVSGIIGKWMAALVYAFAFQLFAQFVERRVPSEGRGQWPWRDLFSPLSYRERYEAMYRRAVRDSLTGLFNRGFFDERLEDEVRRAERYDYPMSVLLIDVDDFKEVNDRHGHLEGDRVLKLLARTIESCSRQTDSCCRFGGDEFAIIAPHASEEQAIELGGRISAEFAENRAAARPPFKCSEVSVTIGVATCHKGGGSLRELLAIADSDLYRGKRQGRGSVGETG